MFSKIMLAYDGSVGGERALLRAIEMARLAEAPLVILTVYRHHSMLEASLSMVRKNDPGSLDNAMKEAAREAADHAKKKAQEAGLQSVQAFIKLGPPARTAVRFAREQGCDLIVVGSRGLGSSEGYLLGSVSHKITGLADVPVLVV